MRKFTAILLACVTLSALTACSSPSKTNSSAPQSDQKKTVSVGVIQYAPHPSLDNCYEGFVAGMKEAGYVEGENLQLDFVNAQGSEQDAIMAAKNLSTKQPDLVLGIATPAAMALYSTVKNTDIPLIFSAVSDPVSAKIVESMEKPGTNATGTSDLIPAEAMLKMIKEFLPKATKVGILYTTSEPNSLTQIKEFKAKAAPLGLTIVEQGVTNESEIAAGTAALIAKGVDAIQNTTDNNVVNNLSVVLKATNEAGIPVFGSEVEQARNGALAAQGIDYIELGRQTGLQAAKVLGGAKVAQTPVLGITDSKPSYNGKVAKALGIDVPAAFKDAENVG